MSTNDVIPGDRDGVPLSQWNPGSQNGVETGSPNTNPRGNGSRSRVKKAIVGAAAIGAVAIGVKGGN